MAVGFVIIITPSIAKKMEKYSNLLSLSPPKAKLMAAAATGQVKFKTIASENGSKKIATNIQVTLTQPKIHLSKKSCATSLGTKSISIELSLQNVKLPNVIPNALKSET